MLLRDILTTVDWLSGGVLNIELGDMTPTHKNAKYRTREEVQNIKDKKDPIENFQKHLLNEGLDEDEFKKIDKNIKEIVSEAADFALESSEPDLTDLYKDIYLDN